jgi:NAD(P)-dependent dehydrogenase (short-subunit alcohol dehydrogenase family)
MSFSLAGKTAIITGGASGIGLSISRVFASAGAMVHILELNYEQAKTEAGNIRTSGGRAVAHAIDITDQRKVMEEISTIAAGSAIDILVNNAGIAHIGNAANTSVDDFDKIVRVNIKGTYNCLHACLPFMQEQGYGVSLIWPLLPRRSVSPTGLHTVPVRAQSCP